MFLLHSKYRDKSCGGGGDCRESGNQAATFPDTGIRGLAGVRAGDEHEFAFGDTHCRDVRASGAGGGLPLLQSRPRDEAHRGGHGPGFIQHELRGHARGRSARWIWRRDSGQHLGNARG